MLLDKGVIPIIVFDGSQLPIKSKVEAERRKRRKEYREKGKALLREGKRSEAHDCFQKCIDVSPEMAHAFIKVCAICAFYLQTNFTRCLKNLYLPMEPSNSHAPLLSLHASVTN